VDAGRWFCNTCSHDWKLPQPTALRFRSLDDLIAQSGLRRDEVVTLADIGALNTFGYDRRSALWQAERSIRPSGELFGESGSAHHGRHGRPEGLHAGNDLHDDDVNNDQSEADSAEHCPLKPMTEAERLVADYAGMGLTIGRHPMAHRRDELAMRGVLRAVDLSSARPGRRVRVAGMVITRQRPGTAKGFVFLTLEDETGIANVIVRPDLFAHDRLTIIEEQFLLISGVLQNEDGVTAVRAEAVHPLRGFALNADSHDFY
jgi:error-prone DNA polymerase